MLQTTSSKSIPYISMPESGHALSPPIGANPSIGTITSSALPTPLTDSQEKKTPSLEDLAKRLEKLEKKLNKKEKPEGAVLADDDDEVEGNSAVVKCKILAPQLTIAISANVLCMLMNQYVPDMPQSASAIIAFFSGSLTKTVSRNIPASLRYLLAISLPITCYFLDDALLVQGVHLGTFPISLGLFSAVIGRTMKLMMLPNKSFMKDLTEGEKRCAQTCVDKIKSAARNIFTWTESLCHKKTQNPPQQKATSALELVPLNPATKSPV